MPPLPSLNHQPQMASAAQPLTFIQLHVSVLNRYSYRQSVRSERPSDFTNTTAAKLL